MVPWHYLLALAVAFVLALPMAIERERHARSAGIRTFPLVAMASCGFVLTGRHALGPDPDALSRVLYGLMTGIGFIGGGAILKSSAQVRGTATAASLWATGGIGAAVGFEVYGVAVALSLVTGATLLLTPRLKDTLGRRGEVMRASEGRPEPERNTRSAARTGATPECRGRANPSSGATPRRRDRAPD